DSASSFRNKQVPWWLGPREAPAELGLLHERLHETMTAARVIPERMRFVPHLTILRDARAPLPTTTIRPIEWRVEEFVLVRSRLDA
ncbi:UNVERIFIED_CONTAM: RNA 2',3'-cyclic phosphodiesterase, partial [Salmonella enterica subsp. enterica serovar Weltevreden]